jgi:hypothetical protein
MALVNHTLETIFIAVPKTGSTSVMEAFRAAGHEIETQNRHEPAIAARVRLGSLWNTYAKVSFVRHPMAWVDSYFRFVSRRGAPISDPERFIRWVPTIYGHWLSDKAGEQIVSQVYRTEDMDAVMAEFGVSPLLVNEGMNRALRTDWTPYQAAIEAKFHKEFAHYA